MEEAMSEHAAATPANEVNTSTTDGTNPSGDTSAAGDEFKPITSQEDLNRVIAERVRRAEAKFSDYKDLKTKASEFDKMTEAQKSEAQRLLDRAEAAERRVHEFESKEQVAAWKAAAAEAAGVPISALRGSTEDEINEHAETLKALLPPPDAKRGAVGPYVPAEGQTPTSAIGSDPRQQFADLLKNS